MDRVALRELVAGTSFPEDLSCEKSRELVLNLLDHSQRPFSRKQFEPGHVTATALVFAPDRASVLLVLHRRLQRWLLPGGHVDAGDDRIFDTAGREAEEETGVELKPGLPPCVAGFDVHGIPGNHREPYHLHHDVLVRLQAASDRLVASQECREAIWCAFDHFDRYNVPGNIRRAALRFR